MQISVVDYKINVNKLEQAIDSFIAVTGVLPYIFMSQTTADIFERQMIYDKNIILYKKGLDEQIAECQGCRIFHNNSLPLGEIELR